MRSQRALNPDNAGFQNQIQLFHPAGVIVPLQGPEARLGIGLKLHFSPFFGSINGEADPVQRQSAAILR